MAVINSGKRWQSRSRFPKCCQCVLFTCQIVTPSLSFCCFTEPSNLSTRSACTWCRRTRGVNPCGNDGPGGWDCSMKISVNFIHVYPLKKSYFCSVWHEPLSRWPSFEGLLLLAPKSAGFTFNHCTEHCVPVSHLHVPHQNSTSTCFSTA